MKKSIESFKQYLTTEEKAENTVEKYIRDVRAFREWYDRMAGACSCREWSVSKKTVIYVVANALRYGDSGE